MIIYNHNKELVGIDAQDLKALGFRDLNALKNEATDFADLFVKTPGHVHNFKHVHWIDFVLCAKSAQESKAIIHANGKNFKVNLEVKTFFLSDSPSKESFGIILNNLKSLSGDEKTQISNELQTREVPVSSPLVQVEESPVQIEDEDEIAISLDDFETDLVQDPYAQDEIVLEDEAVDIYEPSEEELANIGEAQVEVHMDDEINIQIDDETDDDLEDFSFDPHKTAEALEMPISLIEEFVQDFISQAKEFKDSLYNAVIEDDMMELQAYSHKLKGVAANLRIQDALEILTKINKAKDFTNTKKDLDIFYRIVSKLSGEKIQAPKKVQIPTEKNSINKIMLEEEPIKIDLDDSDDLIEINMDDDFDILDDKQDSIQVETAPVNKIYNKQSVAIDIGIEVDSFNELFDDYINESQNLISTIDDAIINNIPEVWREASIKLKGMSDNMRIDTFKTSLEILVTSTNSDEAKDALAKIQTAIFNILETKD